MAGRRVNPVPKPPRIFTDTKPVSERRPPSDVKSNSEQTLNIQQRESPTKPAVADQSRVALTTQEETPQPDTSYTLKMKKFFESQ